MAIDTACERRSAGNFIIFPICPVPDGTVDTIDRSHVAGFYCGLRYDILYPATITEVNKIYTSTEISALYSTIEVTGLHDTAEITSLYTVEEIDKLHTTILLAGE